MNCNDACSCRSARIGFRVACLFLGLASAALPDTWITFDVPGAGFTQPVAINGAGDIAGASGGHGFLRRSTGVITVFDVPGALSTSTTPVAMNANGDITGNYVGPGLFNHGFLRTIDGTFTTFDVPGAATQAGTQPTSINASGTIVGWYLAVIDNFPKYGAFIRAPDGTFTTFDVLGGPAFPLSINDSGEIAGGYTNCGGFLRAPGGTITTFNFTFDLLGGACAGLSSRMNMNATGDVTGTVFVGDTAIAQRGFLRSNGGAITIFSVFSANAPGSNTVACCINSSGQIAGTSYIGGPFSRMFLLENNGAIGTFSVPTCESTFVYAMNDVGWVTGTCNPANSQEVSHAFLRMVP